MNFQQLRIIRELTQHNLNLSQTAHALKTSQSGLIYAELSGDFPLGNSRQPTYKSLRPFDLVS